MENKEAIELLRKYKAGTLTDRERIMLESWHIQEVKLNQTFQGLESNLKALDEAFPFPRNDKTALKKIWPAMAAAAIIVITLSAGLFFYLYKPANNQQLVKKAQPVNNIVPGGNKATLTLADGSTIILNDAANGKMAKQCGIEITKTADGQLVYSLSNSKLQTPNSQLIYNVIETPKGGQYQVNFPDGTRVWLNAGSSLRYPVIFAGNERKVELTGEAYFEVAKNKKLPFKVVSHTQTIEVLGTHFNVNSYKDEAGTKTTLLEGSVRVASLNQNDAVVLKPGQQSQINSDTDSEINIVEADAEEVTAWKNGYFRFNNEGIESIMRKVSRWYDVNIQYQGAVSNEEFNGTISRTKNISEVLEMLETTNAVHFKIEGRRITVMK